MTILLTQTRTYREYDRLFIFYKSDISFYAIIDISKFLHMENSMISIVY